MNERILNRLKVVPDISDIPDLECDKCAYKQHSWSVQWVEWGSKFLCRRCQRSVAVEWVEE